LDAERAKELYENLDVLAAALSEHPLGDAHQDLLWNTVWRLTGHNPADFEDARRWLKARDFEKR
jgi:hypothetical protein